MPHLVILGRQPELSLAELEAQLGPDAIEPFGSAAIVTAPIDPHRLGGAIKLADIIARQSGKHLADLKLDPSVLPQTDGKTIFAVSLYGSRQRFGDLQAWGLTLKKHLGSARLVLPQSPHTDLTAAQLKFNRVLAKGFELIIVIHGGELITALTEAVQDIDAYAARDQARPARDARVGMLPPKLAQILVNLAGPEPGTIVDPFAGSGVIAQEALLLGHPVVASDLEPRMVTAAKQNLTWLAATHPDLPAWSVTAGDARNLRLPGGPVSIVTEGYLGPPLSGTPSPAHLDKLDQQISQLTKAWLTNLGRQIKTGTTVVLTLPQWQLPRGHRDPQIVDELPRLGYTTSQFRHAPGALVYRRSGQFVGRRILVLRKV